MGWFGLKALLWIVLLVDIVALFAFWDSLVGIAAIVMVGLAIWLGYELLGKGKGKRKVVVTGTGGDSLVDSDEYLYHASMAAASHHDAHHHVDDHCAIDSHDHDAGDCAVHDSDSGSDFDSGCDPDPD